MKYLLQRDITYLKGVGPRRAKLLEKYLGIRNFYDLMCYYPLHYVDRSRYYSIAELSGDMPMVQVRGRFRSFNVLGEGARMRLVGSFHDGRNVMEVVWFNQIRTLRKLYHEGTEYVLFGKPTFFNGRPQMAHPEVEPYVADAPVRAIRGVYSIPDKLRAAGFSSRTFQSLAMSALESSPFVKDPLPADVLMRFGLVGLREALSDIHSPRSVAHLEKARFRLKLEELFYLQLNILHYARMRKSSAGGFVFPVVGRFFNTFYREYLPFELTGAQKRVIKEIRADMRSGRQMNRLLQGDVGSGKTLVALLTMLIALDNGRQACIMAPTEILATQHYETLSSLVAPMGINVKLLTGSTSAAARKLIHEGLESGTVHILVGTHAVLEDKVRFGNLGYVVIDEQHRFGVAQRARLWSKNFIPPHVLVMTATPIPRTLAMTVYGDLDVSVIDELPPGRKPVVTVLRYDDGREGVWRAVGQQLRAGRQVYVVYPLIKENEKLDLRCLEEGYESVCEMFRDYNVAFVHGKMKPAEKDWQMGLFARGEARILVSTTVIEVGVNVPNATIMIIENAERFGLSQLHQLRGRVGRGADQSYCVLMTKRKIAKETRKRLEIMTSTNDGFAVAEADLKMRGPGDLEGTVQSGLPMELKIASLASDGQILALARKAAEQVLDADPGLSKAENYLLREQMTRLFDKSIDWSMIS